MHLHVGGSKNFPILPSSRALPLAPHTSHLVKLSLPNIFDLLVFVGLTAVPLGHVYVGTKHAVVGFSRSVAVSCCSVFTPTKY